MKTRLSFLFAFTLWLAAAGMARAQGTAFTYQGRLADNGTAATGNYDLQFTIYDSGSDGSAVAGPLTNSALGVSNGLFTVTLDFGAGVFDGTPRWIDIGVRTNGGAAFTHLSPRQQITSAPYAVTAGNVTGPINGSSIVNGSITSAQLASGAVTAANIASNSITASQLAAGAAVSNLNAGGQSGVASGGVVLSTNPDATNLVNAGYVKLTGIESAERYRSLHNAPPGDRYTHTAVWTGSEMIVWGGVNVNGTYLNDGARYSPVFDLWTPISAKNAPTVRAGHSGNAVAGIMIIWGGSDGVTTYADGGYYNPASDEWTPIPVSALMSARAYHTAVVSSANEVIIWGGIGAGNTPLNTGGRLYFTQWRSATAVGGAPSARYVHRAVWTGTKMIVWGGALSGSSFRNDGALYDPTSNTWTAMSASPLASRYAHVMVWTGSRVLTWGGLGTSYYNDGASYDPVADTWTTLNNASAPSPRFYSTGVWTGSDMIVFGGQGSANTPLADGASYSPAANAWTTLPTADSPSKRYVHTAVWTGDEMIVWGGYGRGSGNTTLTLKDGARFNPAGGGSWKPLPAARGGATTVWTGSELLIWGGGYSDIVYSGGLRLDMAKNTWRPISIDPAIPPRFGHTAIWSGSEMIVWGGYDITYTPFSTYNYTSIGGRYSPASDSWTTTDTTNAPMPRSSHTTVWTGSEMIVWGGYGTSAQYLGDGGRYDPAADSWTPVPADAAVSARVSHKAVWTGSEMLVWGGFGDGFAYSTAGARYNPVNSVWTPMSTVLSPTLRTDFSAVWTGSEMIVWGGVVETIFQYVNDGGRYNPGSDTWTAIPPTPLISGRGGHAAVWTGSEMLIWGGRSTGGGNSLGDGGRYDPAAGGGAGKWNAIPPNATIGARSDLSGAVWTGSEMILHTPYASERGSFADVFSYTPPKTLYLYVRP